MEAMPTPDPGPPEADPQVVWQLLNLEGKVEVLTERLDRLEASLREAVAEEVRGATGDLRRAMNELGRRLVQELPHELRRHRDAIVAELRPPPPPPPPEVDEPAVDAVPEPEPEVDQDERDRPEADAAAGRRASRRRRRQG